MRLDSYLAENGYAKSRTFAKTLIDGGFVNVNGKKANKASLDILDGDTVEVTGKPYEYVSRGGLKLEAALDAFGVDPSGKVCVDIGASSGGFTDCLLRRGAVRVFAVDSGSDQLDASLRADGRVVSMENFNARYLTAGNTIVARPVPPDSNTRAHNFSRILALTRPTNTPGLISKSHFVKSPRRLTGQADNTITIMTHLQRNSHAP